MRDSNGMKAVEAKRLAMIGNWGGRHFINMLDEMFDLQKKFGSKFVPFGHLSLKGRERWTKEFLLCLIDESCEVLNWTRWKHWKRYDESVDELELKYELVDMLHFLLSLMLVWGMTAEECFSMYVAKNRENHSRQMEGYGDEEGEKGGKEGAGGQEARGKERIERVQDSGAA